MAEKKFLEVPAGDNCTGCYFEYKSKCPITYASGEGLSCISPSVIYVLKGYSEEVTIDVEE